jgi:phage/plasmid-associated DNA primase
MVLAEPNDDETMSNGTIKKLTGGDRFFARFLHDNGGGIQTTFKILLICNNIPMIPYSDKATRNRLRVIPHLSTWVDNPPESSSEQKKQRLFKIDRKFDEQLEGMASGFLWLLVHYYSVYLREGVQPPKLVEEHTDKYWKDNDIYGNFLTDRFTRVLDAEGKPSKGHIMEISNLVREFNIWFSEFHAGLKTPSRNFVLEEISRHWGPADTTGKYFGVQQKVQTTGEPATFF